MDLPNLFNVNVAKAGQRVCVIVLSEHSVLVGLLAVHASGSQMLRISEQVPFTDDETMLVATDQVLLELGDAAADVNEVIFCLEQKWLSEKGELVPEKQSQLKKIKDDLSLKPVGYVLQHETITEYLTSQQPQLSSVVLFLSSESVTATLINHGTIVQAATVGRSGEIQSDVVEALSQVTQKSGKTELPGKILCSTIALEVAELFELQQELLTVIWPESIHFLQSPVVELIKPQLCAQIVVTGAGKALQQLESGEAPESLASTQLGAAAVIQAETQTSRDQQAELPLTEKEYAIEAPLSRASSFGIPMTTIPPIVTYSNPDASITQTDAPLGESPDPEQSDKTAEPPKVHLVSSWLKGLTRHHSARPTKRKLMVLSIGAIIAGLLTFMAVSYFFLSQTATVELKIVPKATQLSQEVVLTLDPTLTEPDVENRKIRAEKLQIELKGSGTTQSTGVKIVGEKAKGSIVVYNKTSAEKSFPAGTVLKTEQLAYTLDERVEVPAASVSAKPGGTGEEKEYGQRTAKVTAAAIGVESNIGRDIALTVADFDSGTYAAKTDSEITGGSSREVRVVQQSDLDVLLADVKKDLLKRDKTKLEEQQGTDQRVLPLDTLEVVKQSFSVAEGTQVDEVALDLTVSASGLAYYTTDLMPIAQAILTELVPSGYSLADHEPQILSAGAVAGTNKVLVKLNLSSQAHAIIEK